MGSTPKLSRDQFLTRMREQMEPALAKVADAANEALPGKVISGSEERVRHVVADPRKHAFETAVQMRVDAAEAAFSPSEGPDHGPDPAQEGAARLHRADDQRARPDLAKARAL